MLTKRVSIILSYDLWNNLKTLAKQRNTSASDLIRQAVREIYLPNVTSNNPNKS